MSISVKNSYANEIAESMIETLGNEEFTSLFKKADLDPLGVDLGDTSKPSVPVAPVKPLTPKIMPKLDRKPGLSPFTPAPKPVKIDPVAGKPYDKGATFKADDDQMVQDSKYHEECHENHEDNQECDSVDKSGMAVDDNVVAAVDFTISHLTKIASALDNNGFAGLANIIDETIKRVAAKK